MTPERYKQVDELFQAALERPSQERAVFLDEVCSADPELRREVEVLLSSDQHASSLIESPALELAPELLADQKSVSLVGRSIGPYRVNAHLGSGGMGEVFLAEDAKLGRNVALKLLPEYFTADEQRLRRFQQEARAASSLNHPNIITIFDIGSVEGKHFIATEYITGETLRQQIARAQIGVVQALDIAIQVAQALAAAHDAGIVHRDIKPENIMVRPDGYVKVLDFGLAKLTESRIPGGRSDAATIASVSTDPGTVMGTASYMSPEQARGRDVDARTDIWSLGVLFFEMLAGRLPFEGETTSDVIAAILQEQPVPLARYAPEAPSETKWIVNKALRKEKDERYQTVSEMLGDLRDLKQELDARARLEGISSPKLVAEASVNSSGAQAITATANVTSIQNGTAGAVRTTSSADYLVSEIKQHKAGAVVVLGLFAIVVAGITFGLYKLFGKDKAGVRAQPIKISRLTTNAKARDAAISFDGKFVVYVMDDGGQQSLWVKQVITGSNVQIVPPANVAYSGLTFSKAADYVYYVKHENKDIGTLYRMPVLGGASKKLIDRVNSAITLSPDGNQMAFLRANHPNLGDTLLMVANADGGGERVLASRKRPELFPWYEGQAPSWSPDGKKIACIVEGGYEGSFVNLIEVRLEDVEEKRITSRGWYDIQRVAWLSDGSGLMISGADQASAFFAAQIWRVSYPSGEAQRITADLNNYAGLSLTANSDSLVAVQLSRVADIWVAPSGEVNRATQITAGGNNYEGGGMPSNVWTLDGRIAYYSRASGAEDIWIMDWDGSNQKQLTVDSGPNYSPTVSGDGRYIVFVSERAGRQNIWRMDIDGSNPKQLTNGTGETLPSCSPDGRWVLYTSSSSGKPTVWRIAIDGLGEPSQLINQASEQSVISPDGKFIACRYRDDPNSPWRMAILPFEGGKPRTILDLPVSSNLYCRWTPDGRYLAYIDTRDGVSNIWSLPVDGGPPKQVTDFTHDRIFFFDWSRDGKHLLLGRGTETSDVILIRNF